MVMELEYSYPLSKNRTGVTLTLSSFPIAKK